MKRLIRALIIDDEPIARQTIRLLLSEDPDIEIVGECTNGLEAVESIRTTAPDLIFLDIQMPGASGFEVLRQLDPGQVPEVVFVTAYDNFAVKAFEVHALDYLLKPFTDDRFRGALQRVKEHVRERDDREAGKRILAFLETYQGDTESPASGKKDTSTGQRFLSRFLVRSTGRVDVVKVDDVDWIEAEGNYVKLSGKGKPHLLREKIGEIEKQLDPNIFVRIHRSTIVRINGIRLLRPLENGEYHLIMENDVKLVVSRSYRDRVLKVLKRPGLTAP
jgi:two-component system LytT family response regulator